MRLFVFAVLLCTLAFSRPAAAQDYKTVLDIPPGQTLVNLSATERTQVDQDTLVATLNYESQDSDARTLQDRINTVMQKALAKAKAYTTVKVSTTPYYVYPYDENTRPRPDRHDSSTPEKTKRMWRGQQGLKLESKKTDDLLKLVGYQAGPSSR